VESEARSRHLVMDVRNGEMLALASAPTYNPNLLWDFSPPFREWLSLGQDTL